MPKQNMNRLDSIIDELDEKRRNIAKQQLALKKESDAIAEDMLKLYNGASAGEKAYIRSRLKKLKESK